MAHTNITIRMDENLKKEAEVLFSDLGLTMTSAFVAFTKQAVREQRIPFILSKNVPNSRTKEAIENTQKGIGLSQNFTSVQDLMDDLNADD